VRYGVADEAPLPEAPPGWTLTPLFMEVQRVKETCARNALENAAVMALIPRLRAEIGGLRDDALAALVQRLDESDALRERDVYHLKQDDEKLAKQLQEVRDQWQEAMQQQRSECAEQYRMALIAHESPLAVLSERFDTKLDSIVAEQAELRAAERLPTARALAEAEAKAAAARAELRENWKVEVGALREQAAAAEAKTAERFESVRADAAALLQQLEERTAALAVEIGETSEAAQRALEAKVSVVQAAVQRLDRASREHTKQREEVRDEANAKLARAQEERLELESRVSSLEGRLEMLEREVSRSGSSGPS
jgi:hypothetical protein